MLSIMADDISSFMSRWCSKGRPSVDGFGLVDEHDRDIIPDLVEEFAFIANESILRVIQINISFAFWASKDVQ